MAIYAVEKALPEIYNPSSNLRNTERVTLIDPAMLNQRKAYLIDVFDTFIMPVNCTETQLRDMIVEQRPRQGFLEFLAHYREKTIGIHTDALDNTDLTKLGKTWGIDSYVTRYFGKDYLTYIDPRTGVLTNDIPLGGAKDFLKMCEELGVDPSTTLIIGDGFTDLAGAKISGIDLLLVPIFHKVEDFSFEELI